MARVPEAGGRDQLLAAVRSDIDDLIADCASLPKLERGIQTYLQRANAVVDAMKRLAQTYPADDGARRALEDTAAHVRDAVEAFDDYVKSRPDRDDAEHVVGRAEVGRYLRRELRTATDEIAPLRSGTQALEQRPRASVTLPIRNVDRSA